MAKWYAVMADREDNDWGYGSHNLNKAKQMLKDAEYEDGYIAVIENDVCIEELAQDELFKEDEDDEECIREITVDEWKHIPAKCTVDSGYSYSLTAPSDPGLYTLYEQADHNNIHLGWRWEKE